MDQAEFLEGLLGVMERKQHWAWPQFQQGQVPKKLLHLHFEQEYEVYVRDFPVLIGWAYVRCDVPEARRELAENLFEEETGKLVAGRPHPELFLEYPRGLGMSLERFDDVELLPAARRYRTLIDEFVQKRPWGVAAAVTTIFIEGTAYDRGELDSAAPRRPVPPLEQHPLVQHYGLPLECLALTKAHRQVEGDHRKAAWRVVLELVPAGQRGGVLSCMHQCLDAWLSYRDAVAQACGLSRPSES